MQEQNTKSMFGQSEHADGAQFGAPAGQCPFCSSTATVEYGRSRFTVACGLCGVRFELTAAAHKRAKTLPVGLLPQIRTENARGRTPCISIPDIESSEGGFGKRHRVSAA